MAVGKMVLTMARIVVFVKLLLKAELERIGSILNDRFFVIAAGPAQTVTQTNGTAPCTGE